MVYQLVCQRIPGVKVIRDSNDIANSVYRQHMDSIVALASLMEETKLPCYFPNTIKYVLVVSTVYSLMFYSNLRARFVPDRSDRAAAQHMIDCINQYVIVPCTH